MRSHSEAAFDVLLPSAFPKPVPLPESLDAETVWDVERASAVVHRGLQKSEVVVLQPPEPWQTAGTWAADLLIEQAAFDASYIRKFWWQLPTIPAVAGWTVADSRVSPSHRLPTAIVRADRPEVRVRIPDSVDLFHILLTPGVLSQRGPRGFRDCRRSDKGRYLESFTAILGGFLNSVALVERRFWRSLFKDMPEATSAPTTEWTYKDLLGRAHREFNAFNRTEGGDDQFDGSAFRDQVESLVERDVFVLGIDQRCTSCDYTTWFSLETVRQTTECPGCHARTSVDPSRPIRLRLNSLVKRGWDNDIVPVLLALNTEVARCRTSFRYSPQMDVFDEDPGRNALTDLDILCVTDGDLVIGEAKTDVGGFGPKDFANLALCAERVRPDRVILFSMKGEPSAEFEAAVAALGTRIAQYGVRETQSRRPNSSTFEPAPPY